MPSHAHGINANVAFYRGSGGQINFTSASNGGGDFRATPSVDASGGSGAHNNLPPFEAAYAWERTS